MERTTIINPKTEPESGIAAIFRKELFSVGDITSKLNKIDDNG